MKTIGSEKGTTPLSINYEVTHDRSGPHKITGTFDVLVWGMTHEECGGLIDKFWASLETRDDSDKARAE